MESLTQARGVMKCFVNVYDENIQRLSIYICDYSFEVNGSVIVELRRSLETK